MTASPKAGNALPLAPDQLVTSVSLREGTEPGVVIIGSGQAPKSVSLRGSRHRLGGTVASRDSGWSATIPLLVSRWSSELLPPPSGAYVLRATAADGSVIPLDARGVTGSELFVAGKFWLTIGATDARRSLITLQVHPPLTEAERGEESQSRLEAAYRAAKPEPLNAIFFESFYGHSASCNPLALDRVFAELRPDIARYWSVIDASVQVPSGSIALIEGSAEWWRIRGSARLLVVNDWLRNRFRKRRFQTVLQTWHGTPLKRIALNRPKVGLRTMLATLRERSRWSILLAQNPHSAKTLRSAYAFFGPIWQEGYPRDDILQKGDAAAVRARLGIADDVKVLLYAPTWRDDRPDHVDHLDVAAFAALLGPGYLTLIRGHSRTIRPGSDLYASNVLDVTGYADVSELFLIADALITDYSSVMFDFSVTGKPIFFFAPDLEHYRQQLRGFYFDLGKTAPGPVVQETSQLAALMLDGDAVHNGYAARYRAWQQRFNPRDDGQAAIRVATRLIKTGAIG